MSKNLDQFDTLAEIIRSCDKMLITRHDPIEIHLIHEAQARAKDRLKLHLKDLTFEQLWALCNSKLGAAMALEKAAKALAVVDITAPVPNGNIEIIADNDGSDEMVKAINENDVVAWVKTEGQAT